MASMHINIGISASSITSLYFLAVGISACVRFNESLSYLRGGVHVHPVHPPPPKSAPVAGLQLYIVTCNANHCLHHDICRLYFVVTLYILRIIPYLSHCGGYPIYPTIYLPIYLIIPYLSHYLSCVGKCVGGTGSNYTEVNKHGERK